MLGEPLFWSRVGLGLAMPLGQFPPNVAVGLLAIVVFGYYMPVACTSTRVSYSTVSEREEYSCLARTEIVLLQVSWATFIWL